MKLRGHKYLLQEETPGAAAGGAPAVTPPPLPIGDVMPGTTGDGDTTVPTPGNEDAALWNGMAESLDSDGDEDLSGDIEPKAPAAEVKPTTVATPTPATTPPAVTPPVTPAPEPVVAQPATPPQPAVTAPQPVTPPVVTPAPVAPAPTPVQTEAEAKAYQEKLAAARTETLTTLEKHYAALITPEDTVQLMTAPEKVIPKLLAHNFLEVYTAVANGMKAVIPDMIRHTSAQDQQYEALVGQFYAGHPKLVRAQHHDTVMKYATAYRQMNPTVPIETMMKDVGIQVMFALGIDPTGIVPAGGVTPPAGAAPVAPFRPAAPGSAPPAPLPKDGNVFSQFAEEFISEDQG